MLRHYERGEAISTRFIAPAIAQEFSSFRGVPLLGEEGLFPEEVISPEGVLPVLWDRLPAAICSETRSSRSDFKVSLQRLGGEVSLCGLYRPSARIHPQCAGRQVCRRRLSRCLIFLMLLILSPPATAGERLVRAWPQSVGLPATMTEELDADLEEAVESGATSGVEAMALVENKIVYHEAFGFTQKTPEQVRLRRDALYDLASLTKVVVTTPSVMILVDRGRIDLDSPVKEYIPEFDGDGRDQVTVRHLLTHTSGLGNLGKIYLDHSGKEEYLEVICKVELKHSPGEDRIYSDLGMILAGFVVERVSGQPLDRFAEENIFRPLRMTHTFFNPPLAKRWRCAATELCLWRKRVMRGEVHDENAFAMGGVAGHAGLFSSAGDLAIFCRMMLSHGTYNGKQILKDATVDQMLEPQSIPGYEYQGLGWQLQEERGQKTGFLLSEKSYGHTGFTGTSICLDPENDAAVILLGNAVHPRREGAQRIEYRVPFHEVFTKALESLHNTRG